MPPLAEVLAPDLAKDNLQRAMYRRSPEGLLDSAWQHIEFALNQAIELSEEDMIDTLETASFLLGSILGGVKYKNPLENPKSVPDHTYYKAMVLNSYLPIFTKRARGQELTPKDSEHLYKSLGYVIGRNAHASYLLGMSEDVAQGLSARTLQPEHILHLASPREECTAFQPTNHDGYFFDSYTSPKMPIQIKLDYTALEYTEPIVILDIKSVLEKAATVTQLNDSCRPHEFAGFLPLASQLIAQETEGIEPLSDAQQQFLHLASRSIVRCYRTARDEVFQSAREL
jgi:hypothetical protein